MSRVVHFHMVAQEPERAMRFYSEVFGWQFQKWDGPADYWMVKTGPDDEPGIDGGMALPMPEFQPAHNNTIGVSSVDEFVAKITEAGGVILHPKMPVPGVGWLAYFQDAEGNVFGLMEADASAK